MKTPNSKRGNERKPARIAGHIRRSSGIDRQIVSLDVLKKFRQLFRAARVHFSKVERSLGLSPAQLWTLWELFDQPGLRVSDLASAMALHQSTASNLIESLAAKGLVHRDRSESDRRVVCIYLSHSGEAVLKSAPSPAKGVLPDALERLPVSTLRCLDRDLSALIQAMRIKAPSAALVHLQDL